MGTTNLSLISTLEDAENFAEHPISAYDPFYTRDPHLFDSTFTAFVTFLQGAVLSNPDLHSINYIHGLYVSVIEKTKAFERATGNSLLNSLHVSGSMFANLYTPQE